MLVPSGRTSASRLRSSTMLNSSAGSTRRCVRFLSSLPRRADDFPFIQSGGDSSSAPPTNAPPPRAATASPTRAARAHMPPPRYLSETPPPLPSGPPCSLSGLPPPPLNRAKTSADLNEMTRSSAGQFRSASTGPSPMPPRPSSAAGSSGPPSGAGTPVGGRRKPISKRYVAISYVPFRDASSCVR